MIIVLLLVVIIGLLIWFFFLRDSGTDAETSLLLPALITVRSLPSLVAKEACRVGSRS